MAAISLPTAHHPQRAWLAQAVRNVARQPRWAATLLAAITLVIAAAVSLAHWPQPRIHDEFSYLLAADTFADGRVSNASHPLRRHFETFHVIHEPSYASKYPPGQGLVLALGQSFAGHPLVGVWCLSAAASAACYWMLLGWTAPRWALAGGLLAATHPGLQLVWGQSYWGGTLAFVGGALVAGAAHRMRRTARLRDALAMASGGVCLALTRPYEGLVFCLLVGLWVARSWVTSAESPRPLAPPWRQTMLYSVAPMVVALGALAAGLASYNRAVTGDPWTMPYQIHEQTYGRSPLFLWQAPSPQREYPHEVFTRFHDGWSMGWYEAQQTTWGWLNTKLRLAGQAVAHFFPPLLLLPLAFIRPWRLGRLGVAIAVILLTWAATWGTVWNAPHYLAAVGPLCIAVMVWGLRHLEVVGRRRWAIPHLAACVLALNMIAFAAAASTQTVAPPRGWHEARAAILADLAATGERHLILVRYGPDHNPHQEWVYNRADIDDAPVVWARAMSRAENQELLDYYADRQVWLLEPDAQPPIFRPLDRRQE